jgi:hypothetical protein
VIGEHLTLEKAEELMRSNLPISHQEEVVIVDENLPHWKSEVETTSLL